MPQLDSLRAFAAFAVLFFHFYVESDGQNTEHFAGRLPWGEWGVHLFFVLSGFLITGILLTYRYSETGNRDKIHQLKQFYIRRSLRIFPLFYFVVIGAVLLKVPTIKETLLWHIFYLSNFYFASIGEFSGPASHFWSLAVEEQFYLFWPFLMIFLPKKFLLPFILLAIISAPLYKIGGGYFNLNAIARSSSMVACLDFLGIGSLLAYYKIFHPTKFEAAALSKLYSACGLVLLCVMVLIASRGSDSRLGVLSNFLIPPLFFAWLIHKASIGFNGIVGHVLEAKPIKYCGRISYGIYIYHPFVALLTVRVLQQFGVPIPQDAILKFVIFTLLTISVASVSWFGFERHIIKFKSRFEYKEGTVS